MTRLVTEKQVAEETGIPARRLQQLRFRGLGPAFRKLGASVRYAPEDVQAWLDGCKVVPGQSPTEDLR